MYYVFYALTGIFGILMFAFIGLWQEKCKEAERLQERLNEQEERTRLHNIETYEAHQTEKKSRDLMEIYLVSGLSQQKCEEIYDALVENGLYGDFFFAHTKKEKSAVLQRLKDIK